MYSLLQTRSGSCLLCSSALQEKPGLPWLKPSPLIFQSCQKSFTIKASMSLSPSSNSAINPHEIAETPILKNTNPRSPQSVLDLTPVNFLERAAVVYGDCPAILYNKLSRTWSETHARCLKLASSIVSLGVGRGDVVSVVAPNVPAMVELHFAVPMAGAVLNTVNLRLDASSIANVLGHCGSKFVFVDAQSLPVVHDAVSLLPAHLQLPELVLIDDDGEGCVKSYFSNYSGKVNGNHQILDYERLVEGGDPGFRWLRPNSEWEPITLNYTSGTTSSPKGVVHSHRGAFLMSMGSLLDWSVPKRVVYLWTLPMFHTNGWSYAWGIAAVGGVHVCLRHMDAPSIYQALERYEVTHMCGAPVVLNMLTNQRKKPLESPVHIMIAGAPPPAPVLGRAESLGFIISHGYGLTETGGLVVTCAWKQEWDKLPDQERARLKARQGVGSVAFSDVDVVDLNSGSTVPRDGSTVGEIVLRGGSLMLGYLKDPEATAKCVRRDGWFYTGDLGVVHPDGYLEVKDRSKDIIICGGENLSSVEVETVLYSHPAVNEAAVVARPSRYWGETPCAFVSLKEEAAAGERPTEKEIREFCKARLPLYMVPRTVVFTGELPKTSTGKIQKFLLRDMAKKL